MFYRNTPFPLGMLYRFGLKFQILWTALILSLSACDKQEKLTALLKPAKEISVNLKDLTQFDEVSFLFIIDTSGSMPDRNKILSDNLNFLKAIFQEYPYYTYNFAFTTMSPKLFFRDKSLLSIHQESCDFDSSKLVVDTELGPYLSHSFHQDSDIQSEDFVCLISGNISNIKGDGGTEPFFDSLSYIINNSDLKFKSRFFSRNNFLALIWISDAYGMDDEEYNYFLQKGAHEEGAELVSEKRLEALRSIKGDMEDIRSYAIVLDSELNDDCLQGEHTGKSPELYPFHLYRFIEKTGGFRVSLCDPFWGKKLKNVYTDLRQNFFSTSVYLKEVPRLETVEVFLNGHKIPKDRLSGWFFHPEELAIRLGGEFNLLLYPGKEDRLQIRYQPVNIELLREK